MASSHFDELLKRTDPKLVVFEMDCGCRLSSSGHSPVEYLSNNTLNASSPPCEGYGQTARRASGATSSWARAQSITSRSSAFATGLKHYFIEQEEFEGDPMTEFPRRRQVPEEA